MKPAIVLWKGEHFLLKVPSSGRAHIFASSKHADLERYELSPSKHNPGIATRAIHRGDDLRVFMDLRHRGGRIFPEQPDWTGRPEEFLCIWLETGAPPDHPLWRGDNRSGNGPVRVLRLADIDMIGVEPHPEWFADA